MKSGAGTKSVAVQYSARVGIRNGNGRSGDHPKLILLHVLHFEHT